MSDSVYNLIWTPELRKEYEDVKKEISTIESKGEWVYDSKIRGYRHTGTGKTLSGEDYQKLSNAEKASFRTTPQYNALKKREAALETIEVNASAYKDNIKYSLDRAYEKAIYKEKYGNEWISATIENDEGELDKAKSTNKDAIKAIAIEELTHLAYEDLSFNGDQMARTPYFDEINKVRADKYDTNQLMTKGNDGRYYLLGDKNLSFTAQELGQLAYMYERDGDEGIRKYIDIFVAPRRNAERAEKRRQFYATMADSDNPFVKAGGTALGFVEGKLLSPAAAVEAAVATAEGAITGRTINKNYGEFSSLKRGADAGRSDVGSSLFADIIGTITKDDKKAADLGAKAFLMFDSAANSVSNMLMGPAGNVILNVAEATYGTLDADIQEGRDPRKTLAKGSALVPLEFVTEMLQFKGLEDMLALNHIEKNVVKRFAKNVTGSFANELPGELVSSYAEVIADNILYGSSSAMEQRINKMLKDGEISSRSEGVTKYLIDTGADTAVSVALTSLFLGGADVVSDPKSKTAKGYAEHGKKLRNGMIDIGLLVEQAKTSENEITKTIAMKAGKNAENLTDGELSLFYLSAKNDFINGKLSTAEFAQGKMFEAMGKKVNEDGKTETLIDLAMNSKDESVSAAGRRAKALYDANGSLTDSQVGELYEISASDAYISAEKLINMEGKTNVEFTAESAIDSAIADVAKANSESAAVPESGKVVPTSKKNPVVEVRTDNGKTVSVNGEYATKVQGRQIYVVKGKDIGAQEAYYAIDSTTGLSLAVGETKSVINEQLKELKASGKAVEPATFEDGTENIFAGEVTVPIDFDSLERPVALAKPKYKTFEGTDIEDIFSVEDDNNVSAVKTDVEVAEVDSPAEVDETAKKSGDDGKKTTVTLISKDGLKTYEGVSVAEDTGYELTAVERNGGITIVEKRSGMEFAHGATVEEAVANVRNKIAENGKEFIDATVEEAIERRKASVNTSAGSTSPIEGDRLSVGRAVADADYTNTLLEMAKASKNENARKAAELYSSYDFKNDNERYRALGDIAKMLGVSEADLVKSRAKSLFAKIRASISSETDVVDKTNAKIYEERQAAVSRGDTATVKALDYLTSLLNSEGSIISVSEMFAPNQYSAENPNVAVQVYGKRMETAFKNIGLDISVSVYYDSSENAARGEWTKHPDGHSTIRLNGAKLQGEQSAFWVVSHELIHEAESKSPGITQRMLDAFTKMGMYDGSQYEAYKARYSKKCEADFKKALDRGDVAQDDHDEFVRNYVNEEIVADLMSETMSSSELVEVFAGKLGKDDANVIVSFLKKLLNGVKKVFNSKDEFPNKFSDIIGMFEGAVKGTGTEGAKVNEATENVGVQFDSESKSAAPQNKFSYTTWSNSEYVQNRDVAASALAKAVGVSKADAERYINNINSIAKYIADNKERLDYEPNLDEAASVLKSNQDYKWTVDMSTLCAKRLITTGTFDAIQKALPNTVFDSEDIVHLRDMLMQRGYEVACGICYVESTRRELGPITADFIERYKESQQTGKPIQRINSEGKRADLKKTKDQMATTKDKSTEYFYADKDYTPTLADLNTTDIDRVKVEHPLVYEAYLNFMNARGQAKPKLLETRAEYKGEILNHFKQKNTVNSRNNAGGLRLQSFSDFEIAHLIDMMQITLDMSKVGLMSQAYTKVPAFAEVFGGTGIKINLSLIAKDSGLDANGNLIFDDVEGINHEEAFRLRDKYSENVGTILVGKNDAHIKAAMADPRIDFIIPFHKSSWKESLYDSLGLKGYEDYTDTQHEKPLDKSRKIHDFQPSEYWDYSKSGDENADIYLKKCREDGRIPKFPRFAGKPGYWKLLIDFKMYDNNGVGSPQTVVKPEFDMDSAMDIMEEYKGGHQKLPVAQDVVDDFVAEYKGEKDVETRFALSGKKVDNEGDSGYNNVINDTEVTDNERELLDRVRKSGELGREHDSDTSYRRGKMGEMGSAQSQKPNTPHTRGIHRSGVSAKGLTDSGLTAEQHNIRQQNKQEGFETEFFTEAVFNGENKQGVFNTDNTVYYPAYDFEQSLNDKDHIRYNATALLKESTIDTYLRNYAAKSTPNYAQAYIAYMSPSDFLELTTSGAGSRIAIERESTKLQENKFGEATRHQPIQLMIDHKTGKVESHEGRHRMVALMNEGIYHVPVLLFDSSNKYDKNTLTDFELVGQFNESHTATVGEAIPLNYTNRDLVIEKFGTMSPRQKMGERYGTSKTLRYSLDDTGVYSLEDAWAEMTKKYGAIPKGEKVYRGTDVSKNTTSRAFKPGAFAQKSADSESAVDDVSEKTEPTVEDLYGEETLDDSYFYAEGDKRFVKDDEYPEMWETTKNNYNQNQKNVKVRSPQEIVSMIQKLYIPVYIGHQRMSQDQSAAYEEFREVLVTKSANNLPAIFHDLGHHLDKLYGMTKLEGFSEVAKEYSKGLEESYSAEEIPHEAAAEFVRHFLMNNDEMLKKIPTFTKAFSKAVGGKMRGITKIANAANAYMSASEMQRLNVATVSREDSEKMHKKYDGVMNAGSDLESKILTFLVDVRYPIDKVFRKAGIKFKDNDSPYRAALETLNSTAISSKMISGEGFYQHGATSESGKGLVRSLTSNGIKTQADIDALNDYLTAKHAVEWIQKGKRVFADDKMNTVEAQKQLADKLEKERPYLANAAKAIYKYRDNVIKYGIEAGIFDKDTMDTMRKMYPAYVPFWRDHDYSKSVSLLKHAKGSGRAILSPIENLMVMTKMTVSQSLYNRMNLAFADAIDTNEKTTHIARNVTPSMKKMEFSSQETKEKLSNALKAVSGGNFDIENFETVFNETIGEKMEFYAKNPAANSKNHIITAMRDGIPYYYQVRNADVYNALTRRFDESHRDIITKIGDFEKKLFTDWSPTFLPKNAFRDIRQAYARSTTSNPFKYLYNYFSAFVEARFKSKGFKAYLAQGGGYGSMVESSEKSVKKLVKKDKFRADIERRKELKKAFADQIREARRSGDNSKIQELKKQQKQELPPAHMILRGAKFAGDVLNFSELQQAIEQTPRYAEFKISRKTGQSVETAIYKSKNVTTMFGRKGTVTPTLNKWVIFSNAMLQSTYEGYRILAGYENDITPHARTKHIITQTTLGILATAFTYFMCCKDDEDREDYEKLSAYMKYSHYVFPIGDGKFVRLPKANQNAIIDTLLTHAMLEKLGMVKPEERIALVEYLLGEFNPGFLIENIDGMTAESFLERAALAATANIPVIGTATELLTNKDFLYNPIVPEYMSDWLPEEQYYESTSEIAKKIGAVLKVSPLKVDSVIEGLGVAGDLEDVISGMFVDGVDTKDVNKYIDKAIDGLLEGAAQPFTTDNTYSNDLFNLIYDKRDEAQTKFDRDPSGENKLELQYYSSLASYISKRKSAIRDLPEDEQRTATRELLDEVYLRYYSYVPTKEDTATAEMYDKIKDEDLKDKLFKDNVPKTYVTKSYDIGPFKSIKVTEELSQEDYTKVCEDIEAAEEILKMYFFEGGTKDKADSNLSKILSEYPDEMIKDMTDEEKVSAYLAALNDVTDLYIDGYRDKYIPEDDGLVKAYKENIELGNFPDKKAAELCLSIYERTKDNRVLKAYEQAANLERTVKGKKYEHKMTAPQKEEIQNEMTKSEA